MVGREHVVPARGVTCVPDSSAASVGARPRLAQPQGRTGLVSGGEQIAILVGPAGAGKFRALDAARAAWEGAGYLPIGLAPSAMAAGVLAESAGLRSETLAIRATAPGVGQLIRLSSRAARAKPM